MYIIHIIMDTVQCTLYTVHTYTSCIVNIHRTSYIYHLIIRFNNHIRHRLHRSSPPCKLITPIYITTLVYTLYTVHYTLCVVQCTVYIIQCVLYIVQCIVYECSYILLLTHMCTLASWCSYCVYCTLYNVQCIVY